MLQADVEKLSLEEQRLDDQIRLMVVLSWRKKFVVSKLLANTVALKILVGECRKS